MSHERYKALCEAFILVTSHPNPVVEISRLMSEALPADLPAPTVTEDFQVAYEAQRRSLQYTTSTAA